MAVRTPSARTPFSREGFPQSGARHSPHSGPRSTRLPKKPASGPAVEPRFENRTEIVRGSGPVEGPEAVLDSRPPNAETAARALAPRAAEPHPMLGRAPVPHLAADLRAAFSTGDPPVRAAAPTQVGASPATGGERADSGPRAAGAHTDRPALPPVTRRDAGEPILPSTARPEPALGEPLVAAAPEAVPAAGPTPRDPGPVGPTHAGPAIDLDALQLLDQIDAGVRKAIRLSRVTVQLHPPELGVLQVAVQSHEGNLSAHFHASHPALHSWLESSAPALRAHLADAGLTFNDVSFSAGSDERGGQWPGQAPADPPLPDLRGHTPHTPPPSDAGPVDRHNGLANWLA